MGMQNNNRELVIMVGATGALGETVARRLVASGLHVIAVGRREEELKKLVASSEHMSYCIADIGDDSAIEIIKSLISGCSEDENFEALILTVAQFIKNKNNIYG